MSRHAAASSGRSRPVLVVALILALAAAGVFTVLGLAGGGKAPQPAARALAPGQVEVQPVAGGKGTSGPAVRVKADLGQIAPANATFGLLLPVSVPHAWAVVTGIGDPRTRLGGYHLPPEVAIVGYYATSDQSHAADSGWPGSEAVVLITTTAAQAAKLNNDLGSWPGRKFVTAVTGTTVLVTQPWNDPAAMLAAKRLATAPGYTSARPRQRQGGQGVLWVDSRPWLVTMAAGAGSAVRHSFADQLAGVLPGAGATWIGTADGDAYTYAGTWIGALAARPVPSDASGLACPPTSQVCSGIGSVAGDPGSAAARMVSTAADGKSLTVDLAGLQDYFGIGGQPTITGLTASREAGGQLALALAHR